MINVTVGEEKTQSEKPFPKLMISYKHKSVILATSKDGKHLIGTLLYVGTSCDNFGEHDTTWLESNFTDYNEPITLQND